MTFHVKSPCDNCPFRREGGVRLRRSRLREIVDGIAPLDGQGRSFACHKTTGACNENRHNLHCAGALILSYKIGRVSQLVRIMERIGLVDRSMCDDEWPEIVDTADELLELALDSSPRHHVRKDPDEGSHDRYDVLPDLQPQAQRVRRGTRRRRRPTATTR